MTSLASPYRESIDQDTVPPGDSSLFPAGLAVLFLAPGFFITRVFVGVAAARPWLATLGTFATVAGVLFALVAAARLSWSASGARARYVSLIARSTALAPLVALALVAMFSTAVSQRLQWAALGGLGGLVLVATARATLTSLSRRHYLAAAPLTLLLIGESIELFGPMASFASRPESTLPRLARALGTVSEACAFAGVVLAVTWAGRRAVSLMGWPRAMAFLAMPSLFTAVLITVPARLPRTSELVARASFGVRFDLSGASGAAHPSRTALMVYTLLFTGLIAAVSLSFATQSVDRGGGVRRALGWASVLMAGFGAVSIAGPVDPLRAVLLALGVLLLEQAAERD